MQDVTWTCDLGLIPSNHIWVSRRGNFYRGTCTWEPWNLTWKSYLGIFGNLTRQPGNLTCGNLFENLGRRPANLISELGILTWEPSDLSGEHLELGNLEELFFGLLRNQIRQEIWQYLPCSFESLPLCFQLTTVVPVRMKISENQVIGIQSVLIKIWQEHIRLWYDTTDP